MAKQKIQLSDHFTYGRLFRFTLPSIVMMVFTSIYGVVDGFFVSNFAGKTAFASIYLIMPFIIIIGSLGFMVGTGGTALVSRILGEGDEKKANKYFSMLIYEICYYYNYRIIQTYALHIEEFGLESQLVR